MPKIVLIYDIAASRWRARLSEICLDFGLKRIQLSAFLGDLRPAVLRALVNECLTLKPRRLKGRFIIHIFEVSPRPAAFSKTIGHNSRNSRL